MAENPASYIDRDEFILLTGVGKDVFSIDSDDVFNKLIDNILTRAKGYIDGYQKIDYFKAVDDGLLTGVPEGIKDICFRIAVRIMRLIVQTRGLYVLSVETEEKDRILSTEILSKEIKKDLQHFPNKRIKIVGV